MTTRCLLSIFLAACLLAPVHVMYESCRENPKKGEEELGIILYVSYNGYCENSDLCLKLRNCTTFYGNLIFRQLQYKTPNTIEPYFPHLREITGYLVIGFFNRDRFSILPALTVIRGQSLLGNYALAVFYCTELKGLDFSSLTTILNGGVRIERNNKLCYIDDIRWKSIVKDTHQNEIFGIVVKQNNPYCDMGCATDQCKVVAGHGNDPNAQHCWGPGENGSDHQCQRFCDTRCGLPGCFEGTTSRCCHEECLGGCAGSNTTTAACYACLHYRIEESGKCVKKCPPHLYLVKNLTCETSCPGWDKGEGQYSLNGVCREDCPNGYRKVKSTHQCERCPRASECPKVCTLRWERPKGPWYRGAVISLPQDIVTKKIGGCTKIIGSLTIELKEGTGVLDEYVKQLETIREIKGHLKIHKTSVEYVDFFPNLEKIDPSEKDLFLGKYALAIYDNSHLTRLWTPRKELTVTRGQLVAKSNPHLCPDEIEKLRDRMFYENRTKIDAYMNANGHRTPCNHKNMLQMNVSELNLGSDLSLLRGFDHKCIKNDSRKCADVTWYYNIDTKHTSRYKDIIFFSIYYRELRENERFNLRVGNDYVDTEDWKSVDVPKNSEQLRKIVSDHMRGKTTKEAKDSKIIHDLRPNQRYAFFVKEVTLGESRFSRIHTLKLSPGIPSPPRDFEASFLSNSSIYLKWKEPNEPNGEITKYQIYWSEVRYSYWKDKLSLDWCKRNVKLRARLKHDVTKNSSDPKGTCHANFSCVCSTTEKVTKYGEGMKVDKHSYSFINSFKQLFNRVVFTKSNRANRRSNTKSQITVQVGSGKTGWSKTKTSKKPSLIQLLLGSKGPLKGNGTGKGWLFTKKKLKVDVHRVPDAEVDGNVFTFTVKKLAHFQNYILTICACTKIGCAEPEKKHKLNQQCATTQASTDSSKTADDLDGDIRVLVDGQYYNISWNPPKKPNAIILKYDIQVSQGDSEEFKHCHAASEPPYRRFKAQLVGATYTARVRAISPAGNGSWSPLHRFYIRDSGKEKGQILVVGVSVGCAVIVVFMFAIVLYYALFHRNTDRGAPGVLYASVNPEYVNSSEVYIPDEWELNREKIELLQSIGQGSFGMVYEGIAHDINGVLECRVAVKTVNENATIRDRIQFLQEASIMKAFDSNHVTKLIGVVSQGQPTFVVMELMNGDLQSFLRERRPEDNPTATPLSRPEMFLMSAQIADGMAYLSARKYVHRDLAARNCFVANDITVKIGDFGLARDIYETDYYRKGGKGLLPVRWMAPESLKDGIFTTSSDVWSYGIVVWEIVTYALQPYQGKSHEELLPFVTRGGCLEHPDDCDELMKTLMTLCWQSDPKLRPSFLEVVRMLEDFVTDEFYKKSFYHEMKRKALEDTFCQDGDLHELLGRPNSSKSKKKGKKTCGSDSSVDSGAYIDTFKPDAEQTPELNSRKNLTNGVTHKDDIFNKDIYAASDPLLGPDGDQFQREDSYYDNDSDVNTTFGDTPVYRHHHHSSSDEESGDLKISKIFFGKPVPV